MSRLDELTEEERAVLASDIDDAAAVRMPVETRPEWVKCVLLGRYDRPYNHPLGPHLEETTWCGRRRVHEWCFIGPTHAAITRRHGDHLLVCAACADAIAEALRDVDGSVYEKNKSTRVQR